MSVSYRRMTPDARVYVAGHNGLVGGALMRRLKAAGYTDLVTRDFAALDLRRQADVERFFAEAKPEFVFLAAAKVGGIMANDTYRADFISDNLRIQGNILEATLANGVQRLLFLGSSCIYPRMCPQPMQEQHLLTGPLECTNEPYAIAKIAGIKQCEAMNHQHGTRYLPVMPTNLYGPGDNFDLQSSHVLPALIRRFHEAKLASAPSVTLWGTGSPKREFLHVEDLADACVYLLEQTDSTELVNIGTGVDLSIAELAARIAKIVGYEGALEYDTTKPDGTPRKLLDVGRLKALGWTARTALDDGLKATYRWYLEHEGDFRGR